jgi:antitoxin MazE
MNSLATGVDTMYHYIVKAKILQWGNSLALRIPKSFAHEMQVQLGVEVEMEVKSKSLIVRKPQFTLSELLQNITNENLHGEINSGSPVGEEIW